MRNGRPNTFWLTGFFNPTGFLTANRQEVCRKHAKDNWALDDVMNYSEVLKQEKDEVKKGPDEGIYVHGLFLDCAKWDKAKDKLADSDPKVLFAPLPVLWITGVQHTEKKSGWGFAATPGGKIDMTKYMKKMLMEFRESYKLDGFADTLAGNDLFAKGRGKMLDETSKKHFHMFVAKALFAC